MRGLNYFPETSAPAGLPHETARDQTLLGVAGGVEGYHPLAIGGDLATTEKKTSNPSALAVVQKLGADYVVRAVCRFKTANEEFWETILDQALDLPRGIRARRVCLDATSERFFASRQRNRLAGRWWSW